MFLLSSDLRKACFLTVLTLLVIGIRASLLEYTELVDPTEPRYASVAHEMLTTGDWITPRLPTASGVIPYLGKPPLHFWLTALSYKLFGEDEWTARLPSFCAAALIMALTAWFAIRIRKQTLECGAISAALLPAFPLFFLYAGASAVDMTLCICTTLAMVSFAAAFGDNRPRRNACLFAFSLGLGMLAKGPVAVILSLLPIAMWVTFERRWRELLALPIIPMLTVFLATWLPWYLACEMQNPGFLHYFIWNENIARYLVHDYGDRYGTGHAEFRGYIWPVFAIAFLPWSFLLVLPIVKANSRKQIGEVIRTDAWIRYVLCWALSPAIFFTFARQIHAAYLLPALPGVALALTAVLRDDEIQWPRLSGALYGVLGCAGAAITFFVCLGAGIPPLVCISSAALLLLAFAIALLLSTQRVSQTAVPVFFVAVIFLAAIPIASTIISENKSTSQLLREIAEASPETNQSVGVASQNTFSHFWTAGAWEAELGEPLHVSYFDMHHPHHKLPDHLLIKSASLPELVPEISKHYVERKRTQRWVWLSKASN